MTGTSEQGSASARVPALNWQDAHRTGIQLRYGDLDAMGHVNNARYAEFLEVARLALAAELGIELAGRSVLARLELDYVRDIRPGQQVLIETLVERTGRTSWTSVSRILADGVPCAFSRSVVVRVDGQGRPEPLPEALKAQVSPWLVRV
ncbi:acyl-CoA thioesterase [Deinococcus arcticus]|uniref:Acyl-CoA thioesterase n=1 Tax=Deinococcus arcticus TaxID=2136176 RepID=A0A2T3WA29_9DEIO|nr:thioesterase family protein [Deinococcus arcticus]PTA68771.1 acyl-CoA thioesterase [Deinococcus arcticus]